MSIRQIDTWVLDLYLNEAGWDGQHQQYFFSTHRDANAVGLELEERVKDLDDDHRLEWEVYKADRFGSFHDDARGLARAIEGIDADIGLADIRYEREAL